MQHPADLPPELFWVILPLRTPVARVTGTVHWAPIQARSRSFRPAASRGCLCGHSPGPVPRALASVATYLCDFSDTIGTWETQPGPPAEAWRRWASGAWVWALCHCLNPESCDGGQGPAVPSQLEPAWEATYEGMGRARDRVLPSASLCPHSQPARVPCLAHWDGLRMTKRIP